MTETFKYDALDRLDTVMLNGVVSRMVYDSYITTVTNASGGIVQELSYDAWGNLRNPTTWSGSYTGVPRFDRGFTGHEHHRHFGLINMTTCL